jgi:hypothetical protein
MEQKRDKTGRRLRIFDPKNALFFAISVVRISTCAFQQFLDKQKCAPHFLPSLPGMRYDDFALSTQASFEVTPQVSAAGVLSHCTPTL